MIHASLFSGIGGPEIAAAMLGWQNAFHCEINDFGRKILEYWFPKSESYKDVKTTNFTKWRGRIDVLTGGFPCQPFSYAGQRRGADDDRYLWPEFKRVISEIRPTWVVGENVAGITTMVEQGKITAMESQASLFDESDGVCRYKYEQPFTIQRVCADLEALQYSVQPFIIPACAVGAPHRRDRVFIVAHSKRKGAGCDCGAAGDERRRACEDWAESLRQAYRTFGAGRTDAADSDAATDTDNARLERDGRPQLQSSQGGQAADEHAACSSGEDGGHRISADTARYAWNTNGAGAELSEESRVSAQCETEPWRICAGIRQGDRPVGERWANFSSVSPVHRGNDGIPFDVDCLTLSFGKWRTESLKAYGNAIVPQVMYEIFRFIEQIEND